MKIPTLVTMHGQSVLEFTDLSNFEAGVILLAEINKRVPGITWGQLAATVKRGTMAGWNPFRAVGNLAKDVGSAVMDVTRSSGDIVGDAFDATGETIGAAVRLFTDKKVIGGMNDAYKGFTDGGGVAGFWGSGSLFGGGEEGEEKNAAQGIWDFITNLGAGGKKAAADGASVGGIGAVPGVVWAIGGGVVLLLALRRR